MHQYVTLLGRLKPPLDQVADYYLKQMPRTTLQILEPRGSGAEVEGKALLGSVGAGGCIVALDERGKLMSSEDFARFLEKLALEGYRSCHFLIGAADGHAPAVREKAHHLLSLSPMTWPHQLAAVMLIEQLYRAGQILKGHPYHRA